MASWGEFSKRLVFGRPLRSQMLGDTLLPKTLALPVFSSDALSSVAYATQEILLVLSIGGLSFLYLAPWVAVAVAVLMVTVVFSYRRTVHAYPSGGGDYEVASVNFGKRAGMLVAAALMVDYVVTVAVSVSAGVDAITSAASDSSGVSWLAPYSVRIALGMLLIITVLNLRGVRESGTAFAVPTYAFIVTVLALVGIGTFRLLGGDLPAATTARDGYGHSTSYVGLALVWLAVRAFASGCTALTGVEAIANGVPAFRKPKSKNAAQTLLMMGVMSLVMFGGITMLALKTHVHYVEDDKGHPKGGTVMSQIGEAVFGGKHNLAYLMLQITTALILSLAANTAFNGFPVLASVLAQDRLLPRQLHTRGDRLVFSNGIIMLALFAGLLIWGFNAHTSELINLYIIGVFIAFTASQFGMVRHWTRHLKEDPDQTPAQIRVMKTSRTIQFFGGSLTGVILVLELFTKFVAGAWISVSGIAVFYAIMRAINAHYEHVASELAPTDAEVTLPSRNNAIVLISKIHKPTLRALAYAQATRPSTLVGLTVKVDEDELKALQEEWERRSIQVPLVVVDSPYREITQPIVKYIREIRRDSPRDVVTVYIPEYVVGHWWEHLLHNQSALRLKGRLLFTPGVMVTSVPWQLKSSEALADRVEGSAP
ncbi:MAG: hypothetical protein QOH99_974, partial [Frankiaceae bacterium]|nr:hypothetical protein [Frankiaceae bacterium]